jgi:hypothetical protein
MFNLISGRSGFFRIQFPAHRRSLIGYNPFPAHLSLTGLPVLIAVMGCARKGARRFLSVLSLFCYFVIRCFEIRISARFFQ